MNVREINPNTYGSLDIYVEVAIGLTVFTSWVAIALQAESYFHPDAASVVRRALWPVFYAYNLIATLVNRAFDPIQPQPTFQFRPPVSVFLIYTSW